VVGIGRITPRKDFDWLPYLAPIEITTVSSRVIWESDQLATAVKEDLETSIAKHDVAIILVDSVAKAEQLRRERAKSDDWSPQVLVSSSTSRFSSCKCSTSENTLVWF